MNIYFITDYNPHEDEQHRMEVDQIGPFGYPPYAGYHPDPRAQALAQQQQQRSLQSKPNNEELCN